jgi:hypothetical protein
VYYYNSFIIINFTNFLFLLQRNHKGSLLGDRPFSLHELTNQDCEVNAPITTSEFINGPEVVNALDGGGGPVDPIIFGRAGGN